MQSVDDGSEGRLDLHDVSTAAPLSGRGSCIAEARRLAAAFLTRVRTEGDVAVSARAVDLTQLVVSELVTNARRHAPGPALMELRITGTMIEVSVRDSVPVRPVARTTDPERIGRHGLEIVRAVAQSFQVRLEPSGKRVTAHIALSGAPGPGGSHDSTGS